MVQKLSVGGGAAPSQIRLLFCKIVYMIANPAKFYAILLTKSRSNTAGKTLKIKNKLIQSELKVELLGLTIDN